LVLLEFIFSFDVTVLKLISYSPIPFTEFKERENWQTCGLLAGKKINLLASFVHIYQQWDYRQRCGMFPSNSSGCRGARAAGDCSKSLISSCSPISVSSHLLCKELCREVMEVLV